MIRPMRPLALGRNLFNGVAWSAEIATIRRVSRFIIMLFSALEAADWTTLATVLAQGDVSRLNVFRASSTCRPRTKSSIGFNRFWDALIFFATARTGGNSLPHRPTGTFGPRDVTAIGSRRRELAQPVAHHVFRYEHRNMPAAVVYAEG